MKCHDHQVSRRIVDIVAAHGGVLPIEKLLGIRDRTKVTRMVHRMLHAWPLAQLFALIRYKVALAGDKVIEEDPRHTSQQCSRCQHGERGNCPPLRSQLQLATTIVQMALSYYHHHAFIPFGTICTGYLN